MYRSTYQRYLCSKCFHPASYLLGPEFLLFKRIEREMSYMGHLNTWCPAEESVSLGIGFSIKSLLPLPFCFLCSMPAVGNRSSQLLLPPCLLLAALSPYHDGFLTLWKHMLKNEQTKTITKNKPQNKLPRLWYFNHNNCKVTNTVYL